MHQVDIVLDVFMTKMRKGKVDGRSEQREIW